MVLNPLEIQNNFTGYPLVRVKKCFENFSASVLPLKEEQIVPDAKYGSSGIYFQHILIFNKIASMS